MEHGAVTVEFFEIGQRCDFVLTKNTALKKPRQIKSLMNPFGMKKSSKEGKFKTGLKLLIVFYYWGCV